ncbi:MAG: hypothetical protein J6C52_13980 [Clostridia bacterium]|nr:hypothetical protein [Clostridia bacterium]
MPVTRQSRSQKPSAEALLDGACMLLSAVGMAAMLFMLAHTFCIPWNASLYALKIPLISFAAGYLLQSLILTVFRYRPHDEATWESTARYFDIRYAAAPLLLTAALSLRSVKLFAADISRMQNAGILTAKEAAGMLPTSCAIALFICAAAGIVCHFYPWSRLMSKRALLLWLAAGFLCTILMKGDTRIGIAFAIYAFSAIFCMNQFYITHVSRDFTVTKLTGSARLANARMLLTPLLLIAAGAAAIASLMRWLYQLIRAVILQLLYEYFQREPDAPERVVAEYFGSGSGMLREGSEGEAPLWPLLIIAVIVLIIAARIVFRRELLDWLPDWLASLFRMLLGSGGRKPDSPTISYHDEVIPLGRKKKKRTYRDGIPTLREFRRTLASLRTDEERLTWAYLVMTRVLAREHPSLSASDTPREVEAKLCEEMDFPQLREITSLMEAIKYAEAAGDAAVSRRVLRDVRSMAERHMN